MEHTKFLNINSSFQEKKLEKNQLFLEKMMKIAQDNQGTLISTEWNGSSSNYQFKDKEDKIFSIKYSHLIDRGWPKNIDKFLSLS